MSNKLILALICLLTLSSCGRTIFVYTISDIIGVFLVILLILFYIVAKILDYKK